MWMSTRVIFEDIQSNTESHTESLQRLQRHILWWHIISWLGSHSVRVKDKHSPYEDIYIYCKHQNIQLWTPHWNIVRSHSHCDDTKVIVNISLRLFMDSLSKNKVTQSWWGYFKSLQWYLELLWRHTDLLCGHTLPLFEHTVSSWGHNSHYEGTKIYCELYKTFL